MPEPDFDQIARQIAVNSHMSSDRDIKDIHDLVGIAADIDALQAAVAEQLRQAWNARGAADGLAVESRVRELVAGEVVGAGIARHVAEAIKGLDR